MEIPNLFQRLYSFLHSLLNHLSHAPPSTTSPTTAPTTPAPRLQQLFDTFDENKDGLITQSELATSLHKMGLQITDSALTRLIERVDSNGDACVDVDEFGNLYRHVAAGDWKGVEEEVFAVFDADGDGFVTEEELRRVLETLGYGRRRVEECRRMIERVDLDGDGRVSFGEFEVMMKEVNSIAFV